MIDFILVEQPMFLKDVDHVPRLPQAHEDLVESTFSSLPKVVFLKVFADTCSRRPIAPRVSLSLIAASRSTSHCSCPKRRVPEITASLVAISCFLCINFPLVVPLAGTGASAY